MKRAPLYCALPLLAAALSSSASEETMRCGNGLIRPGDSMDRVMELCGVADKVTVEQRPVMSGARQLGSYTLEIWRYERGSQQFPAVLEFEGKQLQSIKLIN